MIAFLTLILIGTGAASAVQPGKADPAAKATVERVYGNLRVGDIPVKVEVPLTQKAKAAWLRGRKALPSESGVLLFFPERKGRCITTLGVHLPLSVAFIDPERTIVDVHEMKPNSHTQHCAIKAKWALVMNAGWFAKNEVPRRAIVEGIDVDFPAMGKQQEQTRTPK